MEELQYIAKGFSGAGFSTNGEALVMDFPLRESTPKTVRVAIPVVCLETLINVLAELQARSQATPGHTTPH